MENVQFSSDFLTDAEAICPSSSVSGRFDWERSYVGKQDCSDSVMEEGESDSPADLMLCDSNSKLLMSGFSRSGCADEILMFVNAGGGADELDSGVNFLADAYFEGGTVLRTAEQISEAGDFPSIYKSARVGNFCYKLNSLPPGDYFVDLHFSEIVNIHGPKGMREFNVYVQEEKVLSNLDIFSVVGANKPLQVVDLRVSVKEDGLVLRFQEVNGSPILSGICVRKAPKTSVHRLSHEFLRCKNCETVIEVSSAQKKLMRMKATDKYEKKILELSSQCQLKANECHEAWMSLAAANEELAKVRMELDNNIFQTRSLDETVGKQAESLRDITTDYGKDKKKWREAIDHLHEKIKIMQNEHSLLSHEAHACADSIPDLSKMVAGVQALVAQCEDLKLKYSEEQAKRKELYNQLQESKGNIRVFCRCRPLSKEEISTGCSTVADFDAAKDGELGILTGSSTKKTFRFERVYTPKDNQVDVFADASPLVTSVLDGYNVCIFAYGQTGTGKTFTMEGTDQNRGVNYRTLDQLFHVATERKDSFRYRISVSVLEVYNEQIRDLLATSPGSKRLEVKQSAEGYHLPGIVEAEVKDTKHVWDVLQAGSNARAVGSNNVNEHSSRSHCMLCVTVKAENLMNGDSTRSKLWLVDLAGSERLAKTDAQGERLKEAQNINKSLSALGDVIYALATKSSHIPYRNSKLTHLLQDSLGGDAKTLMFVQISPSDKDLSETLSSLNFATRVRGVELGPAKRQIDTCELQKFKAMLDKAKQDSRAKDETVKKLEDNLLSLESKAKGKDQVCRSQQEKIKELEGQLELKSSMQSQLLDRLKGKEDLCTSLQTNVKELETKLREKQHLDVSIYRQKVEELEKKLQEQVHESESHSIALQFQIKDLESKLKEHDQNPETLLLHQEIKELKDRLREQEKQLQSALASKFADEVRAAPKEVKSYAKADEIKELKDRLREQEKQLQSALASKFADEVRATPKEVKSYAKADEVMAEVDPYILRSSSSVNIPSNRGTTNPRVSDHLRDIRKKRYSRDTENNAGLPSSLNDNSGKARKSDPPRAGRVTTVAKPAAAAQGSLAPRRITRDQSQRVNVQQDAKKKIWSR